MGRKLVLYTDGSVRSGGRAGVGVVVATEDGYPLKRLGEPLTEPVTVNECEYIALLTGLREALRLGADSVEVCLDSELVRQQVLGNWQCNHEHLRRLRDEARALLAQFQSWTLQRVESRFNPLAHTYANIASTQNRRRFFWQHPRKHGKGGKRSMIIEFAEHSPLPTGSYPARGGGRGTQERTVRRTAAIHLRGDQRRTRWASVAGVVQPVHQHQRQSSTAGRVPCWAKPPRGWTLASW
ncbi:MAG: hypothetical protein KatS3mg022_3194 [Armatimonadota bacterium]|nr:MAG: hypothetical protein KatS3mg022_3194 [Armatimonadota bacterium]